MQQDTVPGSGWEMEEEEKGIDVRKIMNKAISLWPWMVLCALVAGIVAFLYLYFATPNYKINAKILIKDEDKKAGMSDVSMLQNIGLLSGASSVDNELEIIESYTLMYKVVNELQLNVSCYTRESLKTVELYGKNAPFIADFLTFNDSLLRQGTAQYEIKVKDDKHISLNDKELDKVYHLALGDTFVVSAGKAVILANPHYHGKRESSYLLKVSDPSMVARKYMDLMEASIPNKQVSTINLTLTQSIPAKGEAVVNTLIREYMQANVDDNNRIADSTMSFIDARLLVVGDQLTDIEKQIQNFKQKNELADLSEQAKVLIANTGEYAKQQAEQEVQLSVIESLEKYLLENTTNPRVVPASLLVQDPTLTAVTNQYNSLLMQRSRLLLATTESNPMVQNLDQQLKDIRADMLHGIASVRRSAEVALRSVRGNAGQLEAKIRQVPAKERVFLDYSRQQAIRQELYLFLLQKREETAISRSSTIANARIIDTAKADDYPFQPKKKLIMGLAVLLGVILPFGFVYVKDMLNTKLSSKHDIELDTHIPILGEIGHNEGIDFVVVTKNSRSIVSEQFRAMRTNLQFLLTHKDDKVIMITSSMSGEGKSFIATNLATVLALTNKKVVLLELDLRKPKITKSLGLNYTKGFSQYAIGQASIEEIIQPSRVHENLFLIPSGPIPPNPTELLLHERTSILFDRLKQDFDYVIVDTTPNLVTDAQLLSHYAHATLYIVRLEVTRKEQLKLPNALYRENKMPRLSLVVNDIKHKKYGGGYYGYGYGYGYGAYAEDEQTKKKNWVRDLLGSKS